MDGTPFGRYELLELLGRGGMGEVWRARDTATDRVVAVKVLLPHWANDDVFQQRFRREAHAAASLNEPHVVPIHDYGEIDGRLFVDMRLINGSDLQTLIAEGPLPPSRAIQIVEQVAMALDAAHEIGLVHRDVKPSNVLVAKFDFTYLIDFGIAQASGQAKLTQAGSTMGTWHYMSPERFTTGEADKTADIYALACVLHEALTGVKPFEGNSFEQQVTGHLKSPPPRPSHIVRGLPQALDAVVTKGMAKTPSERYQSATDFAHAAKAALVAPPEARTAVPPRQAPPGYRAPIGGHRPPTPAPFAAHPPPPPAQPPHQPPPPHQSAPPPQYQRPVGANTKGRKPILAISAIACAVLLVVAVVAVIAAHPDWLFGSGSATTTPSSSASGPGDGTTTTRPARPQETIADYVKTSGLTETSILPNDATAPTLYIPIPPDWEGLGGADVPEGFFGIMQYAGQDLAADPPRIVVLYSRLSGNGDPQRLLDNAPGELNNLRGYRPIDDGETGTFGGYDAYQLGGTWVDNGQTRFIAQTTVVVPISSNEMYVIQLNAHGPVGSEDVIGAATDVIDSQSTITN